MPTSLTLDEHVSALDSAGARLISLAVEAGFDAPLPTCPAWDTRQLLAHQAMVHRWATAHVRRDDPNAVPTQTWIRASVGDLASYYDEGRAALVAALRAAPPDLAAMRFLDDAPAPREFWARRQAHETTIHMVDALAAAKGRIPTASEADIEAPVAVDGLDELLRGFFTRGQSKFYAGDEYTVVITPTDVDRQWIVHVAPTLTVAPEGAPVDGDVGATIGGAATEIYLTLWNRGDEATVAGRPDILEQWHATQRVRWS